MPFHRCGSAATRGAANNAVALSKLAQILDRRLGSDAGSLSVIVCGVLLALRRSASWPRQRPPGNGSRCEGGPSFPRDPLGSLTLTPMPEALASRCRVRSARTGRRDAVVPLAWNTRSSLDRDDKDSGSALMGVYTQVCEKGSRPLARPSRLDADFAMR